MRTITLSDHAGDQANAALQARNDLNQQNFKRYQDQVNVRALHGLTLVENSRNAWKKGNYFAFLVSFIHRIAHAISAKPVQPTAQLADRDENVFRAGAEGEYKVVSFLAARLSDQWIAISGYKNRGGEIDLLLVGPPGIMAVEVKYVNGRIFCNGDQWWRDKYDKYGNLVESAKPISDRGGRGPSEQVNASAELLQIFLIKENTPLKRVLRAVVFSHEAAEMGNINGLTVDCATLLPNLNIDYEFERHGLRENLLVDELARLIRKDHAHNERKTPRTRSESRT